ncbi:hypothetical protein K4K59_006761 [Colletotrichum sp. SAR11_240]|nr:hypothetical protein K4K59_006761 [Colletotrichum sp. SAR11_240]
MDPQPRPPRSALLAALRNNGTTEELRGIGYDVDLQGNWLADSLIFTVDRLEGNLDNLPLAPRRILERHAAAYMSNVPTRPSRIPVRPVPRSSGLARPSGAATWGKPYPDKWVLPRGGTEAWKRMHGMASPPTPSTTPAPLMTMPFADSSAIDSPGVYQDNEEDDEDEDDDADGEHEADHDWSHLSSGLPLAVVTAPTPALAAAAPVAGLPASLIMSPESAAPSSFVSVGEEYRDDKKDDKKDDRGDTGDEDADTEVEYEDVEDEDEDEDGEDDEDDEYAHVLPLVS